MKNKNLDVDIRQLREKLGLTQTQFGLLVGIQKNSVARQEKGLLGLKRSTRKLIQIIRVLSEI